MSYINDENFLAVALIINRSRDGPAFVFHYPPHVQPPSAGPAEGPESDELEDLLFERLSQPADSDVARPEQADKVGNHDEHLLTEAGTRIVPWEHVVGFTAHDLAGILTPARSYHKKLFQLSLDPLVCVSYPIHVPENGKWKKLKKAKKGAAARQAEEAASTAPQEDEPSCSASQLDPGEDRDRDKDRDKDKDKKKDEAEEEKRSSMTMFNLVFILHPRKNETKELVDSLFTHIVKKVNKAYQYSQQHSDFVWKESKRILQAKDRAREEHKPMSVLWKELLQSSSLAASVHDIYEAVSQNKIATLHLDTVDGVLSPSVQVPMPFFISDLPAEDDERQRGLWLTTANAFPSQDALEEPGFLDRNFALLLMDDEKKIVSELQSDRDPATLPMVEFVRLAKPNMSFHQVGQSHVLTLSQVRKFAQHFIFWRRAIAIPPLHLRDIYILSPNCDPGKLPQAAHEWQRAFPLAPPLTNFLAELSACPRPYKTYSPSKAHRPLYLRMLAWLMRGGWVTQLCHFAYVVVWPEILYEVDYEMEAEELAATNAAAAPGPSSSFPLDPHAEEEPQDPAESATSSPSTDDTTSPLTTPQQQQTQPQPQPLQQSQTSQQSQQSQQSQPQQQQQQQQQRPLSPQSPPTHALPLQQDHHHQPPHPASHHPPPLVPNPSTLSDAEHSAEMARLERIALKASREAADKATSHARKAVPVATPHPSLNDAPHLAGLAPHIILDPKKAAGVESRYLAAVARRLPDDGVRAAWGSMSKYFDGRCALERIALQEDLKRKETWGLLLGMREYLICVRHW